LSEPSTHVSLPALIASKLRAEIENRKLRPGDRLPGHRELASRHGVSLSSAREAISMLVGDGLIETRAGHGTFVAESSNLLRGAKPPRTRKEIEELIEAREVLGLSIVGMAAERASPSQIALLRTHVKRLQGAASNIDAYPAAELEFHLALAKAAGNRFLLQAMNDFRALLEKDIALSAAAGIQRFGSLQYSVAAHRELIDAIEDGDADTARRVLFEIMSRHHEFVMGLFAFAAPSADRHGEG
jgi:GntR family transcriptional regulator, transcriptional repressor for pyruvate dehydrogenase complex